MDVGLAHFAIATHSHLGHLPVRNQEDQRMGQIIAFPLPPAPYPDLTADLDPAECVLLSAVRSWVECYRNGDDPIPRLCQGLETAGAPDAAFSIDGLMTVLSRSILRPAEIHCLRCPHLSLDEKNLLRAASLAQADEGHVAEKVLRTTLLSAQGAEFAIGPLEGLGTLFAQARLFLTRRRLAPPDQEPGEDQEPSGEQGPRDDRVAWMPPRSLH
jgi:hypothetical protein